MYPRSASTGWTRLLRAMQQPSSSNGRVQSGGRSRRDSTIDEICRRLDGLPLAVELAAARTKLLGPERLLERLDSALPLLTGGARDAPERQRTLRATIEWSYDLLDEAAKELLRTALGLRGELPARGRRGGVRGRSRRSRSPRRLESPEADRRGPLSDAGDDPRVRTGAPGAAGRRGLRQRHATYFSALAEQAYEHRFEAEAEWSARIELDHDDLRSALDWLSANHPDRALDLAGALGWFWLSRGLLAEGCGRLADALAASPTTNRARARALVGSGSLVARHGDAERGRGQLEEAIGLWGELGDREELASALDSLGWPLIYDAGDEVGALAAFEESLELRRELSDDAGVTRALVGVCQVLVALGDVDRAEPMARNILERAGDDPRTEHFAYHFLADCALIRGDTAEAEKRYRESLQAALPLGDVIETSFEVQGVAMAVAGNGPERALRLAASVEALWESLGIAISIRFWVALLERYIGPARAQLRAEADAVWAEGRAMAFDDAVELALRGSDGDRGAARDVVNRGGRSRGV